MKTFNLKLFLIIIMIAMIINQKTVQAATYNFYFNNTEQGDNSTASPSVTVKDGKEKEEEKKSDGGVVMESDDNKKVESTSPTAEDNESKYKPAVDSASSFYTKKRFRLNAAFYRANVKSYERISIDSPEWDVFSSNTRANDKNISGVSIGGNIYFNDYFGAGLYLGGFNRAELEFNPLNYVNNGKFELGGVLGWSTPVQINTDTLFKWHMGLRGAIKLGNSASIYTALRTALFKSNVYGWEGFSYTQFDLGLTLHI